MVILASAKGHRWISGDTSEVGSPLFISLSLSFLKHDLATINDVAFSTYNMVLGSHVGCMPLSHCGHFISNLINVDCCNSLTKAPPFFCITLQEYHKNS